MAFRVGNLTCNSLARQAMKFYPTRQKRRTVLVSFDFVVKKICFPGTVSVLLLRKFIM